MRAPLLMCLGLVACSTSTRPIEVEDPTPDAGSGVVDTLDPQECEDLGSLNLFEHKILPLFTDDHPSSCGQCHLPGVDFQTFARSTACETFACLEQQGLVDKADPEQSLVLSWIGRAQPDSKLITQTVIDGEYDAFAQWLGYVTGCNACDNATCGNVAKYCDAAPEPTEPAAPNEDDPQACDGPALEALFRDKVYVYRGRCSPCHINDHEDETTPMWIEAAFDCDEALTRTYNNAVEGGYLNLDQPDQSLLLLKPLAEAAGGVVHGGGDKFEDTTDPAYVSFLAFIQHLAACQR